MMAKRQQWSFFSTMEPYSHTHSSTFPPELHQGPRPLVWIANGLGKSSQQKQTTQDYLILTVKLDSVLMCLCVCGKNLNFLSWAIRPVFADPVMTELINRKSLLKKCQAFFTSVGGDHRVTAISPRISQYCQLASLA